MNIWYTIYTSNGSYGGGSWVCAYSFGPMTFECGPNAPQKHVPGNRNHPKARPGTTQKAPKVNLRVPRSKEARKSGLNTAQQLVGVPQYTQKALKWNARRQNRASWNSSHTASTANTDTFPMQEMLPRDPLLYAPVARMTVFELIPSNQIKYKNLYNNYPVVLFSY